MAPAKRRHSKEEFARRGDGLGHSLTAKAKICGDEEELVTWASQNQLTVRPCQHCLRDGFIKLDRLLEPQNEPRDNVPITIVDGATDESDFIFPEEVSASQTYREGSVQRVEVNRYERDQRARAASIVAHGAKCSVCGFDFGAVYGPEFDGYIHVHHCRPLCKIGSDYQVDPVNDLRPVCPNCHGAIHCRTPPFSIDEMRGILARRQTDLINGRSGS